MSPTKMSPMKIMPPLAATLAVALITVAGAAPGASAAPLHRRTVLPAHHRQTVPVDSWGDNFSGPPFEPLYDYAGGAPYAGSRGAGYVFVPGHGIVGEGCGLPTSACPNYARPVD